MPRRSFLSVLLLALPLGSPAALADGIPVEDGRFSGGPTTILFLDSDQADFLRAAGNLGSRKELVLSQEQRAALQRAAGAAPLSLLIYDTRLGESDCACEAQNLGLWFSGSEIEVPHEYLVAEGLPPIGPREQIGIVALAALLGGMILLRIVASRTRR